VGYDASNRISYTHTLGDSTLCQYDIDGRMTGFFKEKNLGGLAPE